VQQSNILLGPILPPRNVNFVDISSPNFIGVFTWDCLHRIHSPFTVGSKRCQLYSLEAETCLQWVAFCIDNHETLCVVWIKIAFIVHDWVVHAWSVSLCAMWTMVAWYWTCTRSVWAKAFQLWRLFICLCIWTCFYLGINEIAKIFVCSGCDTHKCWFTSLLCLIHHDIIMNSWCRKFIREIVADVQGQVSKLQKLLVVQSMS
jgi:hypothetical protein